MKTNSRQVVTVLLLSICILAACGGGTLPTEAPLILPEEPCGNGICDFGETAASCPSDCPVEDVPEATPTEEIDPLGYITFVVKVSDFVNLDESARTVIALIDLFEALGVRGEFYFTGPMARLYAQEHLEVMQRFFEADMTISFHVQPPHPLVPGFQYPLQGLPVNVTEQTIRDYEGMSLDMTTGGLQMENPGGYRYLIEAFGSPPVNVSIPDTAMRGFALPIFQQLGAQMLVLKESERADLSNPFRQEYGMWVRPVDIQISHWTTPGIDASMAWWDMLATDFAASYQPISRLQDELDSWSAERLPFITLPIDEYSFYREGPTPWTLIYYQDMGMTQPKSPPFDLSAPDLSSPRSPENAEAVWEAYTAVVEWAARYMQVVTSAEIVEMAK